MIRYWDASAVVPLVVSESRSASLTALQTKQPGMVTWWGTLVECASAIARMGREESLDPAQAERALLRLGELRESWAEVEPIETVRDQGLRLLRVHHLRAGDALQLAAAVLASRHRPSSMEFVCLDQRLSAAARREGFKVISL